MRGAPLGAIALAAWLAAASATAGDPALADRVLVVVNEASPRSVAIGKTYAESRDVPAGHVCAVRCTTAEEIGRETYEREVRDPIAAFLVRGASQDQILFIVTTLDVPLKIRGAGGAQTDKAAVDSELCLLYRDLLCAPYRKEGIIPNPYFDESAGPSFARFSHRLHDVYLVTRLAAYTVDEARALVERAKDARAGGRFVFDCRNSRIDAGQAWMRDARDRLAARGHATVFDTRADVVLYEQQDVIGYCGWGSNDPARKRRFLGFDWLPGALAIEYVSTSARTFVPPAPGWSPSGRTGQTLAADLVRDGVTVANGHVYEPRLEAAARPHVVFPAYAAGLTAAEAMYLGTPYLSWMNVVLGDPLCAPFAAGPHPQAREAMQGAPEFRRRRAVLEALRP